MPLGSSFFSPFPAIITRGNQFGGSSMAFIDQPGKYLKPNGSITRVGRGRKQKGGMLRLDNHYGRISKTQVMPPMLMAKPTYGSGRKGKRQKGRGGAKIMVPSKPGSKIMVPVKTSASSMDNKHNASNSHSAMVVPREGALSKLKRLAANALGRVKEFAKKHKVASRSLKALAKYKRTANPHDPHAGESLQHWGEVADIMGYGKHRKTKGKAKKSTKKTTKKPTGRRRQRGGDFLGIGNFFRNKLPGAFKKFGNDVNNKVIQPAGRFFKDTVYEKGLKPAGQYIAKKPVSALGYLAKGLSYVPTPFSGALSTAGTALGVAGTLSGKGKRRKAAPKKRAPRRVAAKPIGYGIIN